MSEQRHLQMLVEALRLLAAEWAAQVRALPAFVDIPDEVALTFDEVYRFVEDLGSAGLITPAQRTMLDGIDRLLAEMSKDSSLWTIDALRTAARWHEVRSSARALLDALGEKPQPPCLFWVRYVPYEPDA